MAAIRRSRGVGFASVAALALVGCLSVYPAAVYASSYPSVDSPVQYVNTLGGTGAGAGSTIAGPTMPNGSIHPSPETLLPANGGYTPGQRVVGFGQLYAQGTGGRQSYGNFLLSPQTGPLRTVEANHSSAVAEETASADYYSATLSEYGIKAEVAPTDNAAIYRFTYPEASDGSILIDVSRRIGGELALRSGSVTIDSVNSLITGGGAFDGNWNPAEWDMFFALKFDRLPSEMGLWDSSGLYPGLLTKNVDSGGRLGAYLKFATSADERVHAKIAISFVSEARAVEFLDQQIPDWDFDAAHAAATEAWNDVLRNVDLGGEVSLAQKAKFYTALFHANVQPRDRMSDHGYWDDYYTIWDSWKTAFPFLSLTRPDMVAENINSFIDRYAANGYVSEAFIQGKDFLSGQGGNDIENVICDAYLKNIPGVDWEAAYAAAKGDAAAMRSAGYINSGYHTGAAVATNGLPYSWRFGAGSGTMGFAINDHALAVMAQGLGHEEDSVLFAKRSGNWRNIWDKNRTADGYSGFPVGAFYEANMWEGAYYPVFDVEGMVELMGGRSVFVSRLENALSKGYIDFENEPSLQTVWLLATPQVGRPDLASKWANEFLKKFPAEGYPGDEDNGAMSTAYMWIMSGLFPFAGTNYYYLHGSRLPEITYHLGNGKDFVIKGNDASAANIYVRSATLNGQPLNESWITYEQIMAGGTLEFTMGATPSAWARNQSGTLDPPSNDVGSQVPDDDADEGAPGSAPVEVLAASQSASQSESQSESKSVSAFAETVGVRAKAAQRSVTLVPGKSITVPALLYLSNGTSVASKGFVWRSSNPAAAKVVESTGKIKAVKKGRTVVTGVARIARADGIRPTVRISVKVVAKASKNSQTKVARVSAMPVPRTVAVGHIRAITGKYAPVGATSVKVAYKSSKPDVAAIDKAGTITPKAAGTAVITVKAGNKTKKYKVTVTGP
ncbi:MAG: GH92 family glycosyl hydrolase [Bifidobacteriaceae bacterium]|jgi:predicted alpha-1,2-mannosidase|nr:GH92 family glycosyl hydrolase [Bifidobacteriaceae bacterium]